MSPFTCVALLAVLPRETPPHSPLTEPRPPLARGLAVLLLVLIAATAIWLRNRDILSDLYDYSSMITAAGKIEAGLKPYTDFRSTMQSACYVLPRLVEQLAGRSYLSLTWGGLALSLGGCFALFALLRRRFGPVLAALLAGAFTLAGFAQHVIIFYNPLGLLCLTVVVFGLIDPPGPRAWRSPRLWLVLAALIIGGANKINFQALALGLGGLLVLRAAVADELSPRGLLAWWAALLGFGLVLPIGLELWWTGATPGQWFFNIVTLAEARVGVLPAILSLQSYLKPTYTLHQHVLFQPLHTVGLVALVGLSVLAWRHLSAPHAGSPQTERPILAQRLVLLTFSVAAGVGGVLLTMTNIEIITLTSLGVMVGLVAVAGAFGLAATRPARVVLGLAAMMWMVVGGYAAWTGARVLYARKSLDRSTFVRLHDAPPPLRYLEGVRLDADLHRTLLLLATELEKIRQSEGDLSHVLFGPTLEWVERSSPETIMRGMPVWYDLGTSLRQSDGPWLFRHMERKSINHIFLHPAWESWPVDFRRWLERNFRTVPLGPVIKLYERRAATNPQRAALAYVDSNPFALLNRTGSQINVRTTQVESAKPISYHPSPWGEYFGAAGNWTWVWPHPSRIVQGTLVATATTASLPATVRWQVFANPGAQQTLLASGQTTLNADAKEFRTPIRIEPNGQPLAFVIKSDLGAAAGWREMRILDTGSQPGGQSPPGLQLTTKATQFQTPAGHTVWLRLSPNHSVASADAWLDAPCEIWLPDPGLTSPWHGTLEIKPNDQPSGVTPIVMLLWQKGNRMEILNQFAPPVTSGTFAIQSGLPEPGGIIGIVFRPITPGQPLNAALRVTGWPE